MEVVKQMQLKRGNVHQILENPTILNIFQNKMLEDENIFNLFCTEHSSTLN